MLIAIVVEIRRKLEVKDREIAALRQQVMELQEKRVHDAREMIRVAETGTAATQARTQSDQRFIDVMETLLRRERGGLLRWLR